MCRWTRCAVLGFLTVLGLGGAAHADEAAWLVVEGSCDASAEELARRIDAALAGPRAEDLRARVRIEETRSGYHLTLSAERGLTPLGSKTLDVSSCAEALDASVVVLALAAGRAPHAVEHASTPLPTAPALVPLRGAPSQDLAPARPSDEPKERAVLLGVLGGVDVGTLPDATPYLGTVLAISLVPVELRATARYGLRREVATSTGMTSERASSDFGAVEVAACKGAGSRVQVAVCAGGELGLVRRRQTLIEPGDRVDRDEDAPRLAGVLGGRLSRQAGPIRPELEFSASAVALGPNDMPRASFRMGAGVAAQF